MNILVIGAGSWGSCLANLLAKQGHSVQLSCRRAEQAEEINLHSTNEKYLPKVLFSKNIEAIASFDQISPETELIVSAAPSAALTQLLTELSKLSFLSKTPIVSCTKGLEAETGRRLSEVIQDHFPHNEIAILSGPNHAEEIAQELPACGVIGASHMDLCTTLQSVFSTPYFRIYRSTDVKGIEYGGCIKNTYAIAAGIAAGMNLGDNAVAALVTRALAEMSRLGVALGGNIETFMGLSGVGDLITTCFSEHSRNNQIGRKLGEGMTLEAAVASLGMVAEGVRNTKASYFIAKSTGIETPLINAVYQILYESKPAKEALSQLLARGLKTEFQ